VTASIAERVAAGAALLDERVPGWHDAIDVDRLDIDSPTQCVLGQLYGDYLAGEDALSELADSWSSAVSYGFVERDVDGDELTDAWRALIEQRQTGGAR
jgi:hypothetical protein